MWHKTLFLKYSWNKKQPMEFSDPPTISVEKDHVNPLLPFGVKEGQTKIHCCIYNIMNKVIQTSKGICLKHDIA